MKASKSENHMANEMKKIVFCVIVDFESFSKVLNRPGGFRDPGEPEEYCRGFQVFDKDMTGFIGVGQLRYSQSSNPSIPSSSFMCSIIRHISSVLL